MKKSEEAQIRREIGDDGFAAYTKWKELLQRHMFSTATAEELDVIGDQEFKAWEEFVPFLQNLKSDVIRD